MHKDDKWLISAAVIVTTVVLGVFWLADNTPPWIQLPTTDAAYRVSPVLVILPDGGIAHDGSWTYQRLP